MTLIAGIGAALLTFSALLLHKNPTVSEFQGAALLAFGAALGAFMLASGL